MAKYNTLNALFTAIADSLRGKIGSSSKIVADDFPAMIDGLSTGGITPTGTKSITSNGSHDVTAFATAQVSVPVGITPSGTKNITTNGTHDVANFASASVNVPTGITPSGTKTITENGTFDVANFASALVNVAGLKAKVFTSTVAATATSGSPNIAPANEYIASIRSNPNAFVLVRYLGAKASTAMLTLWLNTNTMIAYNGATGYNVVSVRQSASASGSKLGTNGLTGDNYGGMLCVASDGRLYVYASTTYPLMAGEYQIIAGTMEML